MVPLGPHPSTLGSLVLLPCLPTWKMDGRGGLALGIRALLLNHYRGQHGKQSWESWVLPPRGDPGVSPELLRSCLPNLESSEMETGCPAPLTSLLRTTPKCSQTLSSRPGH